jgi:hypothetical protein
MAAMKATVDMKNSNQYNPRYFFDCSMYKNLCENTAKAIMYQSEKPFASLTKENYLYGPRLASHNKKSEKQKEATR